MLTYMAICEDGSYKLLHIVTLEGIDISSHDAIIQIPARRLPCILCEAHMIQRTKATMNPHRAGEPAIRQPSVNGWDISWNPDDGKWYVSHPDTLEAVGIYKERRNALAYARKHNPR